MAALAELTKKVQTILGADIDTVETAAGELTIEISAEKLRSISLTLRDHPELKFEMLVDLCGVDYSTYGISEWVTETATATGFERAVDRSKTLDVIAWDKPRYAVVYHLLSITHNHRIRVRVFPIGDPPLIDSVISIWNAANWFEREAFDLFGILFDGHPDLRRILTDYGFIGHPFRKDFPLIGQVEMRYDAAEQRIIYEPVSIAPRTLVPKVIRQDNRYKHPEQE